MDTRLLWGDPREGNNLEYQDVDGRIILKCIFKTWDDRVGLDWSGSGEGQMEGACECGMNFRVLQNEGNLLTR